MRVFQEEIFGPVVSVTTFKTEEEALEIANDTLYGLGAGLWTRDINRAFTLGRAIQAGRVWVNCYHLYPAHAAFGVQAVGHRPRESQDDARPLSAGQKYAGELQPQRAGLLLGQLY
jgi:acyl-CoA reductase-like NAD-dependent aldehyde dehydrogenase